MLCTMHSDSSFELVLYDDSMETTIFERYSILIKTLSLLAVRSVEESYLGSDMLEKRRKMK